MRARILIVTSGPLSRNPRALKEAGTLGAAGHDVTVLTVANQERYEAYDRTLLQTAPFRKIFVDHLGRTRRTRAFALRDRTLTWAARRALRWGWQSAAALGPVGSAVRIARGFRADLTIVHTELGLAIGDALVRRGQKVAADFEDWHSRDLLPDAQRGRPLHLLRAYEARLLRRAAYASTTSQAMASALAAQYAAPEPLVLRNAFPLPREQAEAGALEPSFFWFSQTVGPGRMLELFLAAWARTARPSRVSLLGDVTPDYRRKLLSRLPSDRRGLLSFSDVVPPWELPAAIAKHDIGLAIEPSLPDNKHLTASNKIFQYLGAGLAILATPTAGQLEVMSAAPECGWVVDLTQTTALAARLDELIANPARRALMGRAARRAAEERFCWEREAPRLMSAVAAALACIPSS